MNVPPDGGRRPTLPGRGLITAAVRPEGMDPFATAVAAQTTTTTTAGAGAGVGGLAEYWPVAVRAGWFLVGALAVLLPGWLLLDPLVSRLVRSRNRNNPTIDEAVSRYLRLLVVVLAALVGTGTAGYGGLLGDSVLVVSAVTLAVGVAGQAVLGSLVSGLVLVADPQFNVGDYITWDDREGVVQSITLRVTRVLTPGGELVTVPNTVLTDRAVTRPFGQTRSRVVERISLAYEADLAAATEQLHAAARELEGITEAPSPKVYVEELGPDAVVLGVHYWVADPGPQRVAAVESAYAEAAKARLETAGVAISPPAKRELRGRVEVEDGR